MNIGENIIKYRLLLGLTQEELSKRANISRSYLGDLEKNRYNPSVETLFAIARALKVSVSTILGEGSQFSEGELVVAIQRFINNGQMDEKKAREALEKAFDKAYENVFGAGPQTKS